MWQALRYLLLLGMLATPLSAQVFNGIALQKVPGNWAQVVPFAQVTVCLSTATQSGNTCSPLATIYTDRTLSVVSPNPIFADTYGNYQVYAPIGVYLMCVQGVGAACFYTGISGTPNAINLIPTPTLCSLGLSARGIDSLGNASGCFTPTGTPGGTPNQIQWNSAGTFAGFTMSGDGTLVTSTGVLTVTKLNGVTPGGTCTNQAVTVISASGVPTCTTLTSAYVDTSIAKTGTDINTSNQVTATHLASALPVNQGGTGAATLAAHGVVIGNTTSAVNVTTAGTSGQVLTSNGASSDPTFQPAAGLTACSTVTFSATPTFDSTGNTFCFKITLTGDVTSSTFANGVNGVTYTFIVIQDSTGNRKFTPPSQMKQYDYWMAPPSNQVAQQFVYDGTNLNAVGPVSPDTRPFTAGSLDDEFDSNTFNTGLWTWVNQGTSTITEKQGAIFFVPQYAAGENVRFTYQATPGATPWTAATKVQIIQTASAGNQIAGICVSDGTKLECLSIDGSTNQLAVYKWTNTGLFGSTAANWNVSTYLRSPWYLAIQDDGVNLNFTVSTDGIFYKQIFTEARLTFLASVSRVGIYMDTNNATNPSPVATYWWFRRTQ